MSGMLQYMDKARNTDRIEYSNYLKLLSTSKKLTLSNVLFIWALHKCNKVYKLGYLLIKSTLCAQYNAEQVDEWKAISLERDVWNKQSFKPRFQKLIYEINQNTIWRNFSSTAKYEGGTQIALAVICMKRQRL